MKNFVQNGDTLSLTAPYAVSSGGGLLVGDIFGIAADDAANGASVQAMVDGVFDIAKTAGQTFAQGDPVYWDNAAKTVTAVYAANQMIGFATQAAASGDATARVSLEGINHKATARVLRATATLDFPSISAQSQQELTVTVTGAAVGDPAMVAPPAAPNASLVYWAYVSATNTVTVRAVNPTAGAIDPASASFTVMVLKA